MIRRILQKILAYFGLRIIRIQKYIEPIAPFEVLDMAIQLQLTKDRDTFYFIQIGANDGVMSDSLNPLIRKYALCGCLVEPMEDVFEDLKRNYSDQPQLDFRNVMIGDHDGIGEIYRFKRDAPVPAEFFHGLARQDPEYIRKRAKTTGLQGHIESIQCKMQTFESLMADLPAKRISMLYIDTEGSDDKIIDAAFRAGIFPPIINYEWTEMPLERRYALKMKLLDHGYRFIDIGADTVCLRIDDGQPND